MASLPNEWLTAEQVASYLQVGLSTLEKWRHNGRNSLPFSRFGKIVRYRRCDVEALLERNMQQAAKKIPAMEA